MLALNPALGSHCALLVDRLAGLRSADAAGGRDRRPTAPRPGFRRRRLVATTAGRAWQEIDLAALAAHPQFLGIAA